MLDKIIADFPGNDNYGNPKEEYIRKVFGMTDKELFKECDSIIWLSAYAANNPRSDYHWQCNVCYAVCQARDPQASIYAQAHKAVMRAEGY